MPDSAATPVSLDRLFDDARDGRVPVAQALASLRGRQVHVLVKELRSLTQPMFVRHPDGTYLLAIFTSQARAFEWSVSPNYPFAGPHDFDELVRTLPADYGFVVNPASSYCVEVLPEGAAAVIAGREPAPDQVNARVVPRMPTP